MRERASANDVPFTPLDKLFEPTVPQGPELPAVDTLPVEALRPFSGHPFHLYTDEKLWELTRQHPRARRAHARAGAAAGRGI